MTTPVPSYSARQAAVTRRTLIAAAVWLVAVGVCILCDRVTSTACPGNSIFEGNGVCPDGQIRFGNRGLVWVLVVAFLGLAALAVAWEHARVVAAAEPSHESVSRATRRSASRRAFAVIGTLSVMGTLLAGHLVLFAPQADQPFCATTIRIGTHVHLAYPFNCDSPEFMRLAHHPGAILDRDNPRQTRPVYVWVGAALTKALGGLADASGLTRKYGQTDSAYIPLTIFNLIVEAAAVALLALLLWRCGTPTVGIAAICLVLLSSDNMKAFFWTPHQQMFNSLVPVVAILYGRSFFRGRDSPGPLALGLAGIAVGIAGLMYGAFAIVAAAGGAAYLAARRISGRSLLSLRPAFALGSLMFGFALPTIAWAAICRRLSGDYYSLETRQYHEFVWIPQHLHDGIGAFASRLGGYAILALRAIFPAIELPALMVAVVTIALLALGAPFIPADGERKAVVLACWITLAVGIVFFYGLGVYPSRIAYILAPAMLALAGVGLAELRDRAPVINRVVELVVMGTALLFAVHQLMVHGPYS